MKTNSFLLAVLIGLFHLAGTTAAYGAGAPSPTRVSLTVDAAAEPSPALRYSLFTDMMDQVPGNAAIAYARAIRMIIQNEKWKDDAERFQKWLGQPLDQLPADDVEAALAPYATGLSELLKATRYETCDWQVPIRADGVAALLPHLSEMRSAARLLALDLRRCIRQGRFEDAVVRLRAGLTMARQTGDSSILIEGLVGIAIAQQMLAVVEDFLQQPGAPNLYWALTDLPPAFISPWRVTLWERSFLYIHLPVLREIGQRPLTAADLRSVALALRNLGGPSLASDAATGDQTDLMMAGAGWVAYPMARQALASQGMSDAQLDGLSAAEVVLRYIGGAYVQQRDNVFKWFALPYPQARKGLAAAKEQMDKEVARDPIGNSLVRLVMPALGTAVDRFAELDRYFAALRCLEALRAHAARHGGQLPTSLDLLQDLPVPPDPMTGSPFLYKLEGRTATLEPPPLPEGVARRARIYEITVRP